MSNNTIDPNKKTQAQLAASSASHTPATASTASTAAADRAQQDELETNTHRGRKWHEQVQGNAQVQQKHDDNVQTQKLQDIFDERRKRA